MDILRCRDKVTNESILYDETDGIHWEYIPLTPTELRERAYETVKCVTYENEQLTVDEANKKWQEYQAEGNEKAAEITALIAAAKASIRTEYPEKN